MEGNDIGITIHEHIACMFEGLIMTPQEEPVEKQRRLFKRKELELDEDEYVTRTIRRWRVNEMPMKSLIHLTTKLGVGVEVYTFMDHVFVPHIEHWLARKGAVANVYPYENVFDLRDDFKYNRDVRVLFTPDEDDAAILGIRATVAHPDTTFGF